MQEKNKKSLLRATIVLRKLKKYFKKSIDSSLKVYYTMSELERRRAKNGKRKAKRIQDFYKKDPRRNG